MSWAAVSIEEVYLFGFQAVYEGVTCFECCDRNKLRVTPLEVHEQCVYKLATVERGTARMAAVYTQSDYFRCTFCCLEFALYRLEISEDSIRMILRDMR